MSAADAISTALERVITRYGRMLRAVGRRRGLDDAELDELTQEVRVRLWRALAEREKIERVQTSYVYRAAMSAALDMIRQRRLRGAEPLGDSGVSDAVTPIAIVDPSGPEKVLERRELAQRIDRAINNLPEPRDVVVRLHLSGYDRFEIAELLGWTEPKVRNLLYRGLADLRTLLTQSETSREKVS